MPVSARLLGVVVASVIAVASGFGAQVASVGAQPSQGVPELPRILSAPVVLGTKYGTAVRVSYCFRAWPGNPRPWLLRLTVDNLPRSK